MRKRLNVGGLFVHPVPEERPILEEVSNAAFCPLLLKYAQKGYCSRVDCRSCSLVREEFGEDVVWLCTLCSDGLRAFPYWGNGKCEACGEERAVLTLFRVG
jgi:hypothetical protein